MNTGMVWWSNFLTAVMNEGMTLYGPARPRAQYQSWMIFISPTLPQLWSWYPTPVTGCVTPSTV